VLKEVDRNGGAVQVVARNEVALAHHLQVAAHRDRIGADRADDKLIKVDYF
jgi:CubicO group peptidase (beta-lactamase class C family)